MIRQLLYKIEYNLDTFDANDYLLLAACVILVGFVCMRGFGSRKAY